MACAVGEPSQGKGGAAESPVVQRVDVLGGRSAPSAAEGKRPTQGQRHRTAQRARRRAQPARTARSTVRRRLKDEEQTDVTATRQKPGS